MNNRKWLLAEIVALILFLIAIFGIPFLAIQSRYKLNVGISNNFVDISARNDEEDENSGKWIINKSTLPVEYNEKNNPIIYVKKGETVKFTLNAVDQVHGFAFSESEIDIDRKIIPGKTEIVEFNANKTGEYKIICSIDCGMGHHGMLMKIIVL